MTCRARARPGTVGARAGPGPGPSAQLGPARAPRQGPLSAPPGPRAHGQRPRRPRRGPGVTLPPLGSLT